jgi:PhnB protein
MPISSFKPEGWSTITPRVFTSDVGGLVAFLKAAFGAEGEVHAGRPAEVKIGDSFLMVSDGGGVRRATPAFIHLYVQDADDVYRRAIEAGAESIEAPADMPYGDRRATVQDRWGNSWQIATFRGGSRKTVPGSRLSGPN